MWKITALIQTPLAQSRLRAQSALRRYIYLRLATTLHTYRHADRIKYQKKKRSFYTVQIENVAVMYARANQHAHTPCEREHINIDSKTILK